MSMTGYNVPIRPPGLPVTGLKNPDIFNQLIIIEKKMTSSRIQSAGDVHLTSDDYLFM